MLKMFNGGLENKHKREVVLDGIEKHPVSTCYQSLENYS